MQRVMAPTGQAMVRIIWRAVGVVLGIVGMSTTAMGQTDSLLVGPPPHFVASEAPAGAMVDVSRTGVLRQRVSVDLTDVPIGRALAEIRDRAGLNIVYSGTALPTDRMVSIRVKGITVASALAEVLLDTGLDVVMTPSGQLALVKCAHSGGVGEARGIVMGRAVDRSNGESLTGVTVTAAAARLNVTTDIDGRYRLTGLAQGTHILTARYIGYTPMTIAVAVASAAPIVVDLALDRSIQELEQVVVTGTIVPTAMRAVPTPVVVITAADIQKRNIQRIDQLFRGQVPGIFAADPSTLDYATMITARGASSVENSVVKVFIDGTEVADPSFVAAIDANSVERIELIRGPQASTMYGSDAIGGVMQIFMKKGEFGVLQPKGEAKLSVGMIEKSEGRGAALRHEEAVSLYGGGTNTRFNLGGYHRHDGEWTPSYGNASWSVTLGGENVSGPLTTRLSTRYARKAVDVAWLTALRDSGYTAFSEPPFETIESRAQTVSLSFLYALKSWWQHSLTMGYDRFTFESDRTKPRPGDSTLQAVSSGGEKVSIGYNTTFEAKPSPLLNITLTTGFSHSIADLSQVVTVGATRLEGSLDGTSLPLRSSTSNYGIFTQAQIAVADAIFLTAGVRAEENSNFGSDVGTPVLSRVGLSYTRLVGPVTTKLRLSYGESIRPPGPLLSKEITQGSFEQLANPTLGPERQRGVDGGIDIYFGSRTSLSASYYSQRATDLIFQVFDTTAPPTVRRFQYQNVGVITNEGVEVEGKLSLRRFDLSGSISAVNSHIRRLSPGYQGGHQIGDRPLRVPRMTAGITMDYSPMKGTTIRGTVSHAQSWTGRDLIAIYAELYGGAPPRDSERDYWIEYPGFTKLDLGVEQQIRGSITALFQVNNFMDNRNFESENLALIPSPRTFTFGMRATY